MKHVFLAAHKNIWKICNSLKAAAGAAATVAATKAIHKNGFNHAIARQAAVIFMLGAAGRMSNVVKLLGANEWFHNHSTAVQFASSALFTIYKELQNGKTIAICTYAAIVQFDISYQKTLAANDYFLPRICNYCCLFFLHFLFENVLFPYLKYLPMRQLENQNYNFQLKLNR